MWCAWNPFFLLTQERTLEKLRWMGVVLWIVFKIDHILQSQFLTKGLWNNKQNIIIKDAFCKSVLQKHLIYSVLWTCKDHSSLWAIGLISTIFANPLIVKFALDKRRRTFITLPPDPDILLPYSGENCETFCSLVSRQSLISLLAIFSTWCK